MWKQTLATAALAMACTDDSGTARQVAPPPPSPPSVDRNAPEPPGGPPSCTDVATHLAAGLAMSGDVTARTEQGVAVTMSTDSIRGSMAQALVDVCRSDAWTHATRTCAVAWQGDVMRERAKLAAACPGTVRR